MPQKPFRAIVLGSGAPHNTYVQLFAAKYLDPHWGFFCLTSALF